jgi:hypothetical protein
MRAHQSPRSAATHGDRGHRDPTLSSAHRGYGCRGSTYDLSPVGRTISFFVLSTMAKSSACSASGTPNFSPSQGNDADRYVFALERRGQQRPSRNVSALRAFQRLGEVRVSRQDVLDVDRLAIKDHTPVHGSRGYCDGSADRGCRRLRSMRRNDPERLPFQAPDRGIRGAAEARGACGHDIHHRLEIGRRAGDHSQDLRRRRLLFQGLLRLLEQPNVLDGNHRLGGEGLLSRLSKPTPPQPSQML